MAKYWVVGGEYTDTRFETIAGGGEETRLGPFDSYDEAKREWARITWETVDDACVRYRIDKEESTTYWVVGGTYTDTRFVEIEGGGAEERIGPFDSYDAAMHAWQQKAWETVDDAHSRYRIEKL